MPARVNYVGKQYGDLTVVARMPPRVVPSGRVVTYLECQCDCGAKEVVSYSELQNRRKVSCRDCSSKHGKWGLSSHPLYGIWRHVISRCADKSNKDYGGRGIVVCSGWTNSFLSFEEDMGARPSLEFSVDRRDNSSGYTCGHCVECVEKGWDANCRWATRPQQRRNSRSVRFIEYDGVSMCLADWATKLGVSREAMRVRINKCERLGLPVADAILAPPRESRRAAKV